VNRVIEVVEAVLFALNGVFIGFIAGAVTFGLLQLELLAIFEIAAVLPAPKLAEAIALAEPVATLFNAVIGGLISILVMVLFWKMSRTRQP
jgi:hypothetical protein